MISERGGKMRGLELVKRGGKLPEKNLPSKGGPREFCPQIQRREYAGFLDGFVFATMEFFLNDGDPFINIIVD